VRKKIKAAVFEEIQKIVYRDDYPKPIPKVDEVLVRVDYCGICGSDITNFKHKMYQVPLIMGHEISGEVVELGNNVIDVNIGDRVVCFVVSFDVGSRQLKGLGTFQDGGFAEFVKVPKEWVFKIPTRLSTKEAVMIETFALAKRAFKLSQISPEQNIIIFGGGSVGLTTLKALLIEKKPNYVVIVEPNEFLRGKALKLGASYAVPPRRAKIKKVLKNLGEPTFIFDSVGIKETLADAIFFIKKGGTILLEGIHKESMKFSFFDLISKEVTLKGSIGHDREDILSAIKLFAEDKVNAYDFISEVIPLRNTQLAFNKFLDLNDRNFIKILINI
jgi:2-desacetyl-2-hydroxyethyl bacteriochlorophyllide A dehydrogenase